jgi:hypothetical protein
MPIYRNSVSRGWPSRVARLLGALLLPALLMSSCGGGVGEALLVPFITFQFEEVTAGAAGTNEEVHLNFSSDDVSQGKTSGSLTAKLTAGAQICDQATGTYSRKPCC